MSTEGKEVVNNEEVPTGVFKEEESFEENPSPEEIAAHVILDSSASDTLGDIEEEKKHLQEAQEENETNVLASSSSHQTTTSCINDNSSTQKKYKEWYAAPTSIRWQNENSNSYHDESNEEEWEYLFADLFYVPAISSLSELLSSIIGDPVVDSTKMVVGENKYYYSEHSYVRHEAVLCFFAVFFAIWFSWYHQCVYDCKFIARDTFHRLVNRIRLMFVSVAIYQISGYDELVANENDPSTDSRGNECSFYFCMGITLECLISLLLRVETILMTRDDDAVRNDSIITVGLELFPRLILYIAAWITHNNSEQWTWLVLSGVVVPSYLFMLVQHFKYSSMIPMSRQVLLSRIGSWVSIVIGEGIISILNPGSSRRENDLISAVLIIFTLIIMHSLYFSYQGQISASEKFRGRMQLALIELMSIAFIGIGVSAKQGTVLTNSLLDFRSIDKLSNDTSSNATIPEHYSDFIYSYKQSWKVVIDEPNNFKGFTQIKTSSKYYYKIFRLYFNRVYFICLPMLLFCLEVIFWTSNPAYVENIRRLFQGERGSKGLRSLVASSLVFELASLLTVALAGCLNDGMMSLEPVYKHLIGFVLSTAFLLLRIMTVSVLQ